MESRRNPDAKRYQLVLNPNLVTEVLDVMAATATERIMLRNGLKAIIEVRQAYVCGKFSSLTEMDLLRIRLVDCQRTGKQHLVLGDLMRMMASRGVLNLVRSEDNSRWGFGDNTQEAIRKFVDVAGSIAEAGVFRV